MVQWPRLQASNAENPCELIPGQETRSCTLRLKIPHASRRTKTLCRPAGTQRSQVNEYIFLKGKKQCQYEIGSISLGRKGEKILRKMLKAYIYIYIYIYIYSEDFRNKLQGFSCSSAEWRAWASLRAHSPWLCLFSLCKFDR